MNPAIVKTIRRSVLLLAVASVALCAQAGIDKKFYKKTAEKVWKMDLPQFDPKTSIPDSISGDHAAVYIARYEGMTCKYDGSENAVKRVELNILNSNAMVISSVVRRMVKILNDAALEDFTEFSVNPSERNDYSGYVFREVKPAFGARIFKPDGRIVEVDMNEALTVTSGKKRKKEEEYKIAIPGLEVGDVLDYFYYTDYMLEELREINNVINILASYPTLDFSIDIRCAPQLALEYGAYNGAPKQTSFDRIDGMNVIKFTLNDVESIDEKAPYYVAGRQMPYLDVFVFNNTARFSFVPPSARPGGIRHASYPNLVRDVGSAFNATKVDSKIFNTAVDVAKQWIKAHPDASARELADAAWESLNFSCVKNADSMNSRQWSVAFYNLLGKIGYSGEYNLAVTSSRRKPSIDQLVDYSEATYLVLVDGVPYFSDSTALPGLGLIPPYYDRETMVKFSGRPDEKGLEVGSEMTQLRASKAMENQVKGVVDVSLSDTPDQLDVVATYDMTGSKAGIALPVVDQFMGVETLSRYLGQKTPSIKTKVDRKEYQTDLKDERETLVKRLWGDGEVNMTDFRVISDGCRPDSANIIFEAKGTVDGLVTTAGRNLMVNLGMLTGVQRAMTGRDRERDISVIMTNASRTDYSIRFHIPKDYKLAAGALDDLNRSVITPEGSFNTEASVDGDTVTIRVIERYTRSIYNVSSWPNLLKVLDAAYEFNSASIVLQPL